MSKAVKKLNFLVPLVIYPYDVMVSMGETDDELKKSLKKYSEEWDNKMKCYGLGRFYMNEKNQSLIRLVNYPTTNFEMGTLAHEIFHCVTHILGRIGMKFGLLKSDEAYSYLVGYITTQIYIKLKVKSK